MKIQGKQLSDNTITQNNMYIDTNTILSGDSVTNKQFVIEHINQKMGGIHQSRLNQHMVANIATVGEQACYDAVIEFPTSSVLVKVNGSIVNVGSGLDCYFSPDGTLIRSGGNAQKGDYLYWNSNKYDLNTNDEIDFNYLTGYDYVTLDSGTTVTLDPFYNSMVVRYIGGSGTTMTVIISGVSFTVGNVAGSFVWDIGGLDEHTFTTPNESIVITINGENYTIWWDGFGSLIYSLKKGGVVPPVSNSFSFDVLVLDNDTITLPTAEFYYLYPNYDQTSAVYDAVVDWGDNTTTNLTAYNVGREHTYSTAGTYTVSITGTMDVFSTIDSDNSMISGKIVNLISGGNINFKSITFYQCVNLTSIPADFFKYNVNLIQLSDSFGDCSNITSIPIDLFTTNISVLTFSNCFRGCSSITSIPSDIFKYNADVQSLEGCFSNCINLSAITNDVFKFNTSVTVLNGCFQGCTALTSIPTGLFSTNTMVTNLSTCFDGCNQLVTIPTSLFSTNTLVTDFSFCFRDCFTLSTIPSDLFFTNTLVTTFVSTFENCSSLTAIPSELFTETNAVVDFSSCFSLCSSLTSNAPELWVTHSSATGYHCFYADNGLSNYASIPAGWK